MFTDYYRLSFNPFDKQNIKEKDAFRSRDHKEMLSRLEYLKTVRGIGVFTARPGMGKTYALRCFMNGLNPNQLKSTGNENTSAFACPRKIDIPGVTR